MEAGLGWDLFSGEMLALIFGRGLRIYTVELRLLQPQFPLQGRLLRLLKLPVLRYGVRGAGGLLAVKVHRSGEQQLLEVKGLANALNLACRHLG